LLPRIYITLLLMSNWYEIGRAQVKLPEHILSVAEGKRYVFYRVVGDGIEVLRFLHARMEVCRHLSANL
jgi:plasmid stabilization system protein ParE